MHAKEYSMGDPDVDQWIDETHPPVSIAGCTYAASYVLRRVDETAYRCLRLDLSDGQWECGECGHVWESEIEAEACCRNETI